MPRQPLEHARKDPRWQAGTFVETPHGTVHAVVEGAGPDVVLIHGVTDSVLTWHELRAQLAGVRVHALDLPGHGLSDVPGAPLMPDEMARWVAGYLDAAGVSRAVLVGWSLGAAVSVELAAAQPERVRSIVLLGPAAAPFGHPLALKLLRLPLVAERMPSIGQRPRLRRITMRDTYARRYRPSDAVLDRYFQGWEVKERAPFIRSLMRTLSFHHTYERAAQVQVPARILHGAEDRLVPVHAARLLTEKLPRAQLDVLEGIGHSPHVECADVVLAAVKAAVG